jgi:hypothetical protein
MAWRGDEKGMAVFADHWFVMIFNFVQASGNKVNV